MEKNKIITINGQRYDAVTGLPVSKSSTPTQKPTIKATAHAKVVHSSASRSKTLDRRAAKKPANHGSSTAQTGRIARSMDIARSKHVSRFATKPLGKRPATVNQSDIGHVKHPLAVKVDKKRTVPEPDRAKTPKETKQEAISKALATPAQKSKKHKQLSRSLRFVNVFSIGLIVFVLAGCLAYVYMPQLSVHFANARAGVDASYPDYKPDGYKFKGPINYSSGEVTMTFRANAGEDSFTLTQTKNSLTSEELKDKVEKDSKGEYITTKERGRTIYTYGCNAQWVNRSILYNIQCDAKLSPDQIRRIANSL